MRDGTSVRALVSCGWSIQTAATMKAAGGLMKASVVVRPAPERFNESVQQDEKGSGPLTLPQKHIARRMVKDLSVGNNTREYVFRDATEERETADEVCVAFSQDGSPGLGNALM